MNQRPNIHVSTWLAVAFSVMLVLGGGAIVGSAADVEILNQTVGVDGDTSSVYADVNNTATTSANVTVTYTGVDASGNDTSVLATNSVTVASGSVQMDELQNVNSSAYDSVRVDVQLDNTTADSANVIASAGTFQKTSGGGGGFSLDGMTTTEKGIGLFALIALGAMLMKED